MDEGEFLEGLFDDLQPIIEGNRKNPWFKQYETNFESSNNRSTSVCVLLQEVIQTILDMHDIGSKSSFQEEDGAKVEKLSLLLNVGSNSERPISKDFYVVGSMKDRGERRSSVLYVN
ncbi:hypothetical protein M758_UG016400 [Ceratodon purpureus]|nr:hypothetical protein M758_UG016400 [Ceratodon purpureus]